MVLSHRNSILFQITCVCICARQVKLTLKYSFGEWFCLKFTDQTKCDKFFVMQTHLLIVMPNSVVCIANGVNSCYTDRANTIAEPVSDNCFWHRSNVHTFEWSHARNHSKSWNANDHRSSHSIIYTSHNRLKRTQTIDSITFINSVNYHLKKTDYHHCHCCLATTVDSQCVNLVEQLNNFPLKIVSRMSSKIAIAYSVEKIACRLIRLSWIAGS